MHWFKKAVLEGFPMPKRPLGKTKYNASILSLGGQGSLETQNGNIDIIQRAYELGINYFDTSPIYGPSEDLYGEALKDIRKKVFLATKTEKRDYDGAMKDIEKSLKRLKTDYIDLWQIHHLETKEEIEKLSKKDGALKAMEQMLKEKVVKNSGLTGHSDPKILLKMMNIFKFDTVLCPVNPCDKHMDISFTNTVVKEAQFNKMGIIGMKVFAQGYIFTKDGITTPWECINYALSQPVSTIIVGCDSVEQLEENVAIAKSFYGLNDEQKKKIEDKAKNTRRGCFFRKEYGGYDSKAELTKEL